MSCRMVVLSPPGRMSPETSSRSPGSRTRTPSTPIARSVSRCSRKAPCRASTPIFMAGTRAASSVAPLPAPDGESLVIRDLLEGDPAHRSTEALADLGDLLRVVEERRRLDDGVGHPGRILALEDARPDEDALRTELHHERGVGRGADPAGDEVDDRQLAVGGDVPDQLVRSAEVLCGDEQLILAHRTEAPDLGEDVTELADRLDDVAGARLALGPHHRGTLVDPTQRFAEVAAAADERDLEVVLVDVVVLVGRGQDLGLVDVVDAERLEDLGFDEVADAGLRHDRDRHG